MSTSAFSRLLTHVDDRESLGSVYNDILHALFSRSLWTGGLVEQQRVLWTAGKQARAADPEAFDLPGLYIWGAEERPLYLGKTTATFAKRFSRYLWHGWSQCKLACKYEPYLTWHGVDGFPLEIRDWYAKSFRGCTVRLKGAVRFAQEGITKVWFTLLPSHDPGEISRLEKALIPVAEQWNRQAGLQPLLNIGFNSAVRRSRTKRKM